MNKDWLEKDFYASLGVSKTAAADEIKKKYRKLARELHPDKNPGDAKAEERFKEVSEAYDVLSDADKRKEYDEARALFAGGGYGPGGYGPGGGAGSYNVNMDDVFGGQGGDFSDLLGGIFNRGRGRGRTAQPRRGADLESELTLGFDEALDGVTVPLRLSSDAGCGTCHGTGARAGTMPRTCPTCQGSGQVARNAGGFAFAEPCTACRGRGLIVDDPCTTCHGSGRASQARTVQVRIPAGVKDGARIRIAGKGSPGDRGGPAGDLFVVVHVTPHALFVRKGDNVTLTVPITFSEAALGAKITVPTPRDGNVTLRIPAGTTTGRTFRVKGKGVRRKDGSQGDVLVTVEVAVPQKLSDEARTALEAYADLTAEHDPRRDLMSLAGQ
ncbi:MAG: molecular chaperone DnaJ [Candidatus Nanopelagicales bacterium]|nr:molecular chaperone DnaJ [Candidatus Nanopelagicales bacterium]